ncbi:MULTISPECIES: ethanolamine utilization protein [Fusobacterium]|nr:ethanolamine utilization protein [Fusobacterium sp.]MDD7392758.1 ethanolamine utilization protein [Fusobacteriaceae bacterium]MDD7410660.1 ethanolamine utilization protein [Fusobacteriaceae bacterium]MDY5714248.1 ethanolamine utilization protein [Fusobacterium gastrosuis]MDY5794349.1 ethanolamine utilization protein [Fusobacterium gastrosuis]
MLNNINEEYIRKIIQKELEKYFLSSEKEETVKTNISFLGENMELKRKLEDSFEIEEESETLIVSNLSLKNIYNLSIGIYENKFEEKILKQVLEGKKVFLIEEGLEYLKYQNIPTNLLEKYNTYVKNIKDYGIKIQKEAYFLQYINNSEEIYSERLLDYKKLREFYLKGLNSLLVAENTIITSSAMDYAKENNITIVKRR